MALMLGALLAAALAWPLTAAEPLCRPAAREASRPDAFDGADFFRARLLEEGQSYLLPGAPAAFIVAEPGYLDSDSLGRFCAELARGLTAIPLLLGRSAALGERVTVYVYGSGPDAPISQALVPGARAGEKGVMLRYVREDRAPLFHELNHLLAGLPGSASLSEGFADFVQARLAPGKASAFTPAGTDPHARARQALLAHPRLLVGMGAPGAGRWSSPEEREAFYFASWSYVDFLIARGGMPAFLQVFDGGGSDASCRRAFGQSCRKLRADWSKGLVAQARP